MDEDERFVVVDPLTAQLAPQFRLLHNVIPCVVPEPESADLARLDLDIASAIAGVTAQLGTLSALMRGTLNSQHPMSFDYQRLHLGRNYRSSLRDLFIRLRTDGLTGKTSADVNTSYLPTVNLPDESEAMCISPRCSPRLAPTRSPRYAAMRDASFNNLTSMVSLEDKYPISADVKPSCMRRSASLKRSLGMFPEADMAATLPAGGEPKRRSGDGIRSIRSYPSRLSEVIGDEQPAQNAPITHRVRSYASLEALAASAAAAVAGVAPLCNRGREVVSQAITSWGEIAMF